MESKLSQLQLAEKVKAEHHNLRLTAAKDGAFEAWKSHISSDRSHQRQEYALAMKELGSYWKYNNDKDNCRITWTADHIKDYFSEEIFKLRKHELDGLSLNTYKSSDLFFEYPLNVLDVGSCYNPFSNFDFMNVLPIDLTPATNNVLCCDFLKVLIGDSFEIKNSNIHQLQKLHYNAIIFSLLLDYLPIHTMRIKSCEKAYELLKPEGVLVIISPDSEHPGANIKIYNNWIYALSLLGFFKVKYEKLKHLQCMLFRKALNPETQKNQAIFRRKPYMNGIMNIPQDFQDINKKTDNTTLSKISYDPNVTLNLFQNLPLEL